MDPQEQALLTIEQQEIADLKNRVADLEQKLAHLAEWMRGIGDHTGFGHPGFGS
jgi:cell division septum initiation protein DivIVA